MNKVIFAFVITLLSFSSYAQKFSLQNTGYKPVVYKVDSIPATELYKRAMAWVDSTYKNPSSVLAKEVDSNGIIVNGYAVRMMKFSMHNYDFKYQVYIKFKDGKYQLNFDVGDMYTPNGDLSYSNYTSFFKKDGAVKGSGVTAKKSLDTFFNTMADDIYTRMIIASDVVEEVVVEPEEEW